MASIPAHGLFDGLLPALPPPKVDQREREEAWAMGVIPGEDGREGKLRIGLQTRFD